MTKFRTLSRGLVFWLITGLLVGCSGGGGGGGSGDNDGGFLSVGQIKVRATVDQKDLPVNTLGFGPQIGGPFTTTVTAFVDDEFGKPIANGTDVQFAVSGLNPNTLVPGALYYLDGDPEHEDEDGNPLAFRSGVVQSASGVATMHFHATNFVGQARISITVADPNKGNRAEGSAVTITVGGGVSTGDPGKIQILPDDPAISIQGVGGNTTTAIQSYIQDDANQKVDNPNAGTNNIRVEILTGPGGGEKLSGVDADGVSHEGDTIYVASSNGIAQFTLVSGVLPGSVAIKVTSDADDNDVDNGIQEPVSNIAAILIMQGGDCSGCDPSDPLDIITTTLPDATASVSYAQLLEATGGFPPYFWSLDGGDLPPGIRLEATGVLLGTPTRSGSWSFVVRADDRGAQFARQSLTLKVGAPDGPVITTESLPNGKVNDSYSTIVRATGGDLPYTWSVPAGRLPDGLSMDAASGAIAGTPTQAGNFAFIVQVTDASGSFYNTPFTILIESAGGPVEPLVITTASLPDGQLNVSYATLLAGEGGIKPYTWSIDEGVFPPGLVLNSKTGAISGIPETAGSYSFIIRLTDDADPANSFLSAFTIKVSANDGLEITTEALRDGDYLKDYSEIVRATGGVEPYRWSLDGRTFLPAGLNLDRDTGVIAGIAMQAGLFSPVVHVTDANGSLFVKPFTLNILNPDGPTITTASIPDGDVCRDCTYSQVLTATGGTVPYAWTVEPVTPLPPGLTLGRDNGVLSGIPFRAGSYRFSIRVTDASAHFSIISYTVSFKFIDGPVIGTDTLPDGELGVPYSQVVRATGGTLPYTWSAEGLPPGLTINPDTGAIMGDPTQAGTFEPKVTVTDAKGLFYVSAYRIRIGAPNDLEIVTDTLPEGAKGDAYATVVRAKGGVTPYSWAVTAGALPVDLVLNPDSGEIAGIPDVSGTFHFNITVTDADGGTYVQPFTLVITGPGGGGGLVTMALFEIKNGVATPTHAISDPDAVYELRTQVTNLDGTAAKFQVVSYSSINGFVGFVPDSASALTDDNGLAKIFLTGVTIGADTVIAKVVLDGEDAEGRFAIDVQAITGGGGPVIPTITLRLCEAASYTPSSCTETHEVGKDAPVIAETVVKNADGSPVVANVVTYSTTRLGIFVPSTGGDPHEGTALTDATGTATILLAAGAELGADFMTAKTTVDTIEIEAFTGFAVTSVGGGGGEVALQMFELKNGVSTPTHAISDADAAYQLETLVTNADGSPAPFKVVRYSSANGFIAFVPDTATALTDANGIAKIFVEGAAIGADLAAAKVILDGTEVEGSFAIDVQVLTGGTSPVTPTITLRLCEAASYTPATCTETHEVGGDAPIVAEAVVKNPSGSPVVANVVSYSTTRLGVFLPSVGGNPHEGTALTDATGTATILLAAGSELGADFMTARATVNAIDIEAFTGFAVTSTSGGADGQVSLQMVEIKSGVTTPTHAIDDEDAVYQLNTLVTNADGTPAQFQVVTYSSDNGFIGFVPGSATALTDATGFASIFVEGLVIGADVATAKVTLDGKDIEGKFSIDVQALNGGTSPVTPTISLRLCEADGYTLTNCVETHEVGGSTPVVAEAVVKNADETPVVANVVTFTTTRLGIFVPSVGGNPNEGTSLTNGAGIASIRMEAGAELGADFITATSVVTAIEIQAFTGFEVTSPSVGPGVGENLGLATDSPTVPTDNSLSATITATVVDENNAVVEGVVVSFSASSGQLSASSVTTDENGEAKVLFSSGTIDKSNRIATITAKASSGKLQESIPIQVVGTTLRFLDRANNSLEIGGATRNEGIVAEDAAPNPIPDAVICLTQDADPTTPGASLFLRDPNVCTDPADPDTCTELVSSSACPPPSVCGTVPDPDTGDCGLTGVDGQLNVLVAGKAQGTVTLVASGLNAEDRKTYNVAATGAALKIIAPVAPVPPVAIDAGIEVLVTAPGSTTKVSFATSLGVWVETIPSPPPVLPGSSVFICDQAAPVAGCFLGADPARPGNNLYKANLTSPIAGTAVVVVQDVVNDLLSDSITIAFAAVPDDAFRVILDASPRSLPISTPGDPKQSIVIAKVLNKDDQPVAGASVAFTLINATGGGETISPPVVVTGVDGKALATFTAGTLPSGAEGITIKAKVLNGPVTCLPAADPCSDTFAIVITSEGGSVIIGISTTIASTPDNTAYILPVSVLVSDSNGGAVPNNTKVVISQWPQSYNTGFRDRDNTNSIPNGTPIITDNFPNEDANENLIMEDGEDFNGNGKLTPPNSAAGAVPAEVFTDEEGLASFNLTFLKSQAAWIVARMRASALVQGTEVLGELIFTLPNSVADQQAELLPDSEYNAFCPYVATITDLADNPINSVDVTLDSPGEAVKLRLFYTVDLPEAAHHNDAAIGRPVNFSSRTIQGSFAATASTGFTQNLFNPNPANGTFIGELTSTVRAVSIPPGSGGTANMVFRVSCASVGLTVNAHFP